MAQTFSDTIEQHLMPSFLDFVENIFSHAVENQTASKQTLQAQNHAKTMNPYLNEIMSYQKNSYSLL